MIYTVCGDPPPLRPHPPDVSVYTPHVHFLVLLSLDSVMNVTWRMNHRLSSESLQLTNLQQTATAEQTVYFLFPPAHAQCGQSLCMNGWRLCSDLLGLWLFQVGHAASPPLSVFVEEETGPGSDRWSAGLSEPEAGGDSSSAES